MRLVIAGKWTRAKVFTEKVVFKKRFEWRATAAVSKVFGMWAMFVFEGAPWVSEESKTNNPTMIFQAPCLFLFRDWEEQRVAHQQVSGICPVCNTVVSGI